MTHALRYEIAYEGRSPRAMQSPKWSVSLMTGLEWAVRTVIQWNQRSRQRQALAQLDDHLLKDIGISREAAAAESSQPFWR